MFYKYNQGEWHGWNGEVDCPVHANSIVEIIFVDGGKAYGNEAGSLFWEHKGGAGDIVAFRVTDPYRPPAQEFWIDAHTMKAYRFEVKGSHIKHVKEVRDDG